MLRLGMCLLTLLFIFAIGRRRLLINMQGREHKVQRALNTITVMITIVFLGLASLAYLDESTVATEATVGRGVTALFVQLGVEVFLAMVFGRWALDPAPLGTRTRKEKPSLPWNPFG